jgi:hypothetical protein
MSWTGLIWDLRPVPSAAYDTAHHIGHAPAAKTDAAAKDVAETEEAAAVRSLPVKP